MVAIILGLDRLPPRAHTVASSLEQLPARIRRWALDLGFQQVGIAAPDLRSAGERLREWLARGFNADMQWLAAQAAQRERPASVVPGTVRVISARMDYWRDDAWPAAALGTDPARAWVSRYALGRDYHRVVRPRLQKLADRIEAEIGPFGYRAFVDSGPVMEKPIAQQAGLGWIGKHTNLINAEAGSWFFLGEIFTDLPLPVGEPAADHCGSCRACLDACPTGAIVAPYVLDAGRCISWLTIENTGPIPEPLRPLLGNRVYGCDDCQLACPWNKFARASAEVDFAPRHGLDRASLVELFAWSETEWETRTEGSAIRRVGYEGWLRNVAVALGNAPTTPEVVAALESRRDHPAALVREHVLWALARHGAARGG
jgi:epoxyqueuosine reductase